MSDITTPAQPVKRKARTLEEREAALQAELNSLRAKARVKDEAKLAQLEEKLEKMRERFRLLHVQRAEVEAEITEIKLRLGEGGQDE